MKRPVLILFFLVVAVAMPGFVPAEEFKIISTEELAKGIQNNAFEVIDCNTELIYKNNHIPTAVHMDVMKPDINVLPKDKTRPLVFYCKNPRCSSSHRGAKFAIRKGYSNVYVYPEGIDGWIEAKKKAVGGS